MPNSRTAIKTHVIGGGTPGKVDCAVSGDGYLGVVDDWFPQDNIRILGIEISGEIGVDDTASNTDGDGRCIFEISRAGAIERPGCLIFVELNTVWNGILCIGGEIRKQNIVIFPSGYGVDIDAGEGLNLTYYAAFTGNVPRSFWGKAIIYYVER